MSQENTDKPSGDPSFNLDLDFQMLPSWAKEQPGKNPYAEHSGQDRQPRGRRDSRGGGGPGRPGDRRGGGGRGGAGGPRGDRGPGGFRGDRRPRQGQGQGPGSGGPGQGQGQGPRNDFRGGGGGGGGDRRGGRGGRDFRDRQDRGPQSGGDERRRNFARGPIPQDEQPEAYGVKISFLPVPVCVQGVVNQLRSTRTASSLFAIAKLFLAKPERYLLRIKSLKPDKPFFQIGKDGPVAFERSQLEFAAFEKFAEQYYEVETRELEEIKGNFTNVARCRLNGQLLGPTNHHSYQSKLRSLYEEQYRAEMPFERFRHQIEVLNDPESVETWKEEARRQTIYTTKDAENPKTFADKAQARQHFLLNHAAEVIHKTHAVTVAGRDSRTIPDADIQKAMRSAFEMEIRFPNRLAQALRSEFIKAGLHVFKHRKRMLYAWSFRPHLLKTDEANLAPGVREILQAVKAKPGLNRHELAVTLIPELKEFEGKTDAKPGPEIEEKKNELAGYLHYLISEGHVIEFQDGTLEFPIPHKGKDDRDRPKRDRPKDRRGDKPKPAKTATSRENAPASAEQQPVKAAEEKPAEAATSPDKPEEPAAEEKSAESVVSTEKPEEPAADAQQGPQTQEDPLPATGAEQPVEAQPVQQPEPVAQDQPAENVEDPEKAAVTEVVEDSSEDSPVATVPTDPEKAAGPEDVTPTDSEESAEEQVSSPKETQENEEIATTR